MKTKLPFITAIVFFLVLFVFDLSAVTVAYGGPDGLKVWYDRPPSRSPYSRGGRSLPLGNGRIAAMVYGGVERERLALNHERLWRDIKMRGRSNPEVSHYLPLIRKMFFEDKLIEASHLTHRVLGSQGVCRDEYKGKVKISHSGPDQYQPVGDMYITFGHPEPNRITDYRRELDISTGLAKVSYRSEGVRYEREAFVSCTDDVMVVRLSADQPGCITCQIRLSRIHDPECTITPWGKGDRIGFEGEFIEKRRFDVAAAITRTGGHGRAVVADAAAAYHVDRADEVIIVLNITTDSESDVPRELCEQQLDRTGLEPEFDRMFGDHKAEHQRLFGRVELSFGGEDRSDVPTDHRLREFRRGQSDPELVALGFQYGRYILMSGSRPGGMPSPLKGLWVTPLRTRFSNDYHWDINVQENYWGAEVFNLPECHEPLFDYVDRLVPNARIAAKNLYGCRGVFIPLTTGGWGRCLKKSPGWDEWTGAAAWIAQHYWWHYEFTGDDEFLRTRAYPYMKEVARFYEDYLVPDPRPDSKHYGKLVTVPSQSPENHFVGGTHPVSLCVGSTMDFELIYDVLTHLLAASRILGVDEEERDTWQRILDQIPPLQIGRYGQLQEWLEDYEETEPGHRHLSHLFALYPGEQITLEDTPELAQAARVALKRRIEHGCWFISMISKLWARLREGDRAERYLMRMMRFSSGAYSSSFSAGVAEMLLQSHRGQIRLLPALPQSWPQGHVKGLCARGAFEVDITWDNSAVQTAVIRSKRGNRCRIRDRAPFRVLSNGQSVPTTTSEPGVLEFDTQVGGTYVLSFEK